MNPLKSFTIDYSLLNNELQNFSTFLNHSEWFSERPDFSNFIHKNKNLAAYISSLFSTSEVDAMGLEYELFGQFRTDLTIRTETSDIILVEFESGKDDSIFNRRSTGGLSWSITLERAHSQIVDWYWQFDSKRQTREVNDLARSYHPNVSGLIVIGRKSSLNTESEKDRFQFRTTKTIVDSKSIHLLTYDELFERLSNRLESLKNKVKAATI